MYFLHGLPASSSAFRDTGTFARAFEAAGRPAIFAGPQGARDGDDDPEYLDWGTGRNWETALGTELPRYVDAHFRTIRARPGRALVGLSAGGYGAVLLALHRLEAFSVIESWSGYFHPTDPSGVHALDLGSTAGGARALTRSSARCAGPSAVDRASSASTSACRTRGSAPRTCVCTASWRRLACRTCSSCTTELEQALWNRHAATWLRLALDHLAPAR